MSVLRMSLYSKQILNWSFPKSSLSRFAQFQDEFTLMVLTGLAKISMSRWKVSVLKHTLIVLTGGYWCKELNVEVKVSKYSFQVSVDDQPTGLAKISMSRWAEIVLSASITINPLLHSQAVCDENAQWTFNPAQQRIYCTGVSTWHNITIRICIMCSQLTPCTHKQCTTHNITISTYILCSN